MICSRAEIERKRQEALQKLAKKGLSPIKNDRIHNSVISNCSNSPISSNFKTVSPKVIIHNHKPYERPTEKFSGNKSAKGISDFYGLNKVNTLTFSLISSEKFSIIMSIYNNAVIDVFQQIPSRNYG